MFERQRALSAVAILERAEAVRVLETKERILAGIEADLTDAQRRRDALLAKDEPLVSAARPAAFWESDHLACRGRAEALAALGERLSALQSSWSDAALSVEEARDDLARAVRAAQIISNRSS